MNRARKQAEFSESLTNVSACLRARFFHDNECYEFAQRLNMSQVLFIGLAKVLLKIILKFKCRFLQFIAESS